MSQKEIDISDLDQMHLPEWIEYSVRLKLDISQEGSPDTRHWLENRLAAVQRLVKNAKK
jgi:ribosomal protein S19E (S16A)